MELFVLGAGFSKAFNDKSPLMAGFLANNLSLLDASEFKEAKEFIQDCGYDSSCDDYRTPANANIETLMTIAGMTKPWIDTEMRARFDMAAEQLKKLILRVLDRAIEKDWKDPSNFPKANSAPKRPFELQTKETAALRSFVDYLLNHAGKSHIISFNYDILLENAIELRQLELFGKAKRFHGGESYGFHAAKLTPEGRIEPFGRTPTDEDVYLLKLHGSVNWRKRRGYAMAVTPTDTVVLLYWFSVTLSLEVLELARGGCEVGRGRKGGGVEAASPFAFGLGTALRSLPSVALSSDRASPS